MMGRRALDDPRNALLKEFVRVMLELEPRYFLLENVAGLMVGEHRHLFAEVVELIGDSGLYRVLTPVMVLQAADYGTPESRKRLFLLGSRLDAPLPTYSPPTHLPRTIRGVVPPLGLLPVGPSVWQALSDLPDADVFPELIHGDTVRVDDYGETSPYASRLRGLTRDTRDFSHGRSYLAEFLTSSLRTIHTPRSITRFAQTSPGSVEPVSRFLGLQPQGIANTLRAGTNSDRGAFAAPRPIHPVYPRVITVREGARLHGYPDWFRFHVAKWNGFREIGNSVPPALARVLGAAVLQANSITPSRSTPMDVGDPRLLSLSSGDLHAFFGLTERVIMKRFPRMNREYSTVQ